mmetsp:Transcript_76639/g.151917  ORF Transcript_76639/g.151917 Transcript_76639/m.151917 type:complete len:104 (+) Transcript_76639:1382-1693(+)
MGGFTCICMHSEGYHGLCRALRKSGACTCVHAHACIALHTLRGAARKACAVHVHTLTCICMHVLFWWKPESAGMKMERLALQPPLQRSPSVRVPLVDRRSAVD